MEGRFVSLRSASLLGLPSIQPSVPRLETSQKRLGLPDISDPDEPLVIFPKGISPGDEHHPGLILQPLAERRIVDRFASFGLEEDESRTAGFRLDPRTDILVLVDESSEMTQVDPSGVDVRLDDVRPDQRVQRILRDTLAYFGDADGGIVSSRVTRLDDLWVLRRDPPNPDSGERISF